MNKQLVMRLGVLSLLSTSFSHVFAASQEPKREKEATMTVAQNNPLKNLNALNFRIGVVDVKSISDKAPQMRRLSAIHSLEVQKIEEESKKVQAHIEDLGYQMQRLLYQPNVRATSIRNSEEQLRRSQVKLTEQLAELDKKKQASIDRRDQAKTAALSEWVKQVVDAQEEPLDLVLSGAYGIASQGGAVLYFSSSPNIIDLTAQVVEVAEKSYAVDASLSEEEENEDNFAEVGF